jgi:hypothetical protein
LKDILNNPEQVSNFNFKLSNFQTMMDIYNRLQEQYDSSNKSYKGKINSGNKERATKQYFKDTAAHARRKQGKPKYDTRRREEQPDKRDIRLEEIHFANFLGLPRSEDGIPYNNVHIDEPVVNIIDCDIYLKPEPSKNVPEEVVASQEEEDDTYNLADYINTPQIQLEANTVWNMNWAYEPETKTLTGYSTFKRGHDEEEVEEPAAKRVRSDSYEISRMEEGVQVFNQEEINFAAMVAYMKEQVALAEQLAAEAYELYPCDCLDCRR